MISKVKKKQFTYEDTFRADLCSNTKAFWRLEPLKMTGEGVLDFLWLE